MSDFSDLVSSLNDDTREYFEERASVREFDGGLPRDQAECLALLDTLRRDPLAFAEVTVLRVEQGGVNRVVLITDPSQLSALGITVLGAMDLRSALAQFQGMAVLTRSA